MEKFLLWLGKIYTEGNAKGTNRAAMKVELIFLCGVAAVVAIYRLSVDKPSDNFTGIIGGIVLCFLTILFWIGEAKFQKIIRIIGRNPKGRLSVKLPARFYLFNC